MKYSVCRKSVRQGKEVERPVELLPSFAQQEFDAPVAANVFQHHHFYVCKKHGHTLELHEGYRATSSNTMNNFRKRNRILLDVTFRHVNVLSKLLSRNSLYIGLQVGCLCACYPQAIAVKSKHLWREWGGVILYTLCTTCLCKLEKA